MNSPDVYFYSYGISTNENVQAGYFHKNKQIRTKPLHAEFGASRDKNKKGLHAMLFSAEKVKLELLAPTPWAGSAREASYVSEVSVEPRHGQELAEVND